MGTTWETIGTSVEGVAAADPADGVGIETSVGGDLVTRPLFTAGYNGEAITGPGATWHAFQNVAPATDYVIRPEDLGWSMFTILKNADAPELFEWSFSHPDGSVALDLSAHELRTQATGALLAQLTPMWARDATGAELPFVISAVNSDTLRIQIAHRASSVKYPIVVEPTTVTRTNHTYIQKNGLPVPEPDMALRVRGWLARSSIMDGYPCYTLDGAADAAPQPSGQYRQECSAHAHALRKLNQIARGEPGKFAPVPDVQWEVGPLIENRCIADKQSTCDYEYREVEESPKNSSKKWRADILVDMSPKGMSNENRYAIYEVKKFRSASWAFDEVNNDLNVYERNLGLRNVGTHRGFQLQDVYANGWTVWFIDRCHVANDQSQVHDIWYAWVPKPGDSDFPGKSWQDLAGHIYFAISADTPKYIQERDHVFANADYHSRCAARDYVTNLPGRLIRPGQY